MDHQAAADHNRRVWDELHRRGQRFTTPARDEDLRDPLRTVDTRGWLGGDVSGKRLLCLAGGGGRQSAIYARAGADVTVIDISPAMIEQDRRVAHELALPIHALVGSMHNLSMLDDASFDIVIHPVSTCYLPDVAAVYREVARVTRPSGLYISQHKQPVSLQGSITPRRGRYALETGYYESGPLPEVTSPNLVREPGAMEFLHRWEDLVGGLCRAGFVIEDLTEPYHHKTSAQEGSFEHRSGYLPPYVRIKARRVTPPKPAAPRVWTP
jgi:SAM-dependent methyltransferase